MTFGDPIYNKAVVLVDLIGMFCLFFCILICVSKPTNRKSSCLILMGFYSLYSFIMGLIFHEITAISYMLESLVFFAWAVWIMLRDEPKSDKNINHSNILLAFYKGNKGSFIMRFFELFGTPVKSLSIIAGDKALYLKSKNPNFIFGDSNIILRKSDSYVIIDTGVKYTEEFISEMQKHNNIIATRGIFRIRCIEAVSGLLGNIDDKFKPTTYIPSLYLRGLLNA